MNQQAELPDRIDVLVVGGGQAGLGMGYRLREAGVPFVIVDDRARTGDVWRARWRSLVLFTPRRFAALPGLPLPESTDYYPTREQLADYLEHYAAEFALAVVRDTRVTAVTRDGDDFVTETSRGIVRSCAVVMATGPFQYPRVPRVGAKLAASVAQLHSHDYTRPDDPLPVESVGAERFATPPASGLRVTWLGHSTMVIEIDVFAMTKKD